MAKVKYCRTIKDGLLHFPDRYCTIAKAAEFLGVSRQKIKKLIENRLVIYEQPKNKKARYVELNSLGRLKHPELEPDFDPLTVGDTRNLQKEIDSARQKIGKAANLPPGAVKIFFDLG